MTIPDLKGLFENSDLRRLFETAQRIQTEVARVKDELGGKTVEAETGGGLVRCVASGKGEILSLSIDPAIVRAEDKKMVEDLAVGAVNLALERARQLARDELSRVTGGLPLPPGMFGS